MADQNSKGPRAIALPSAVLDDGTIVEMVFRPEERATVFLAAKHRTVDERLFIEVPGGIRAVPFAPTNNLLTHRVVRLASAAEPYADEESLLGEVRAFIHRYTDLTDAFEELASHYVLFTWVYDAFNEVPYLRVRGDFGTGKSRFLTTVGSLCYKPIFASGASTVSPLFRVLDAFRGTLVLDESDFRFSDEKAEIVKILNNGNAAGFPVLRSEVTPTKEYDPRAFHVFGPKIIASRGLFADRALESRCITEELGGTRPRADIPLNLPATFDEEALRLRNQLLTYRFRNLQRGYDLSQVSDAGVEPRIAQILSPLLATIRDGEARERLMTFARRFSASIAAERGMTLEAQLLDVIWKLRSEGTPLRVGDITERFTAEFTADFRRPVTPRWIGNAVRTRLGLTPVKSHGTFMIPPTDDARLERLFVRYNTGEPSATAARAL